MRYTGLLQMVSRISATLFAVAIWLVLYLAPPTGGASQNTERHFDESASRGSPKKSVPVRSALSIGVQDGDTGAVSSIFEMDAVAMKNLFRLNGFSAAALTGHEDTCRGKVIARLREILENEFSGVRASDNFRDNLLIFSFHGHGLQVVRSDLNEDILLCCSNYEEGNSTTHLYVSQVIEEIQRKPNVTSLLMIDACRKLKHESIFSEDRTLPFASKNRLGIFFACSRGEFAWSVDELEHSLFTWAVLEGLKGGASDNRRPVVLEDLVGYVTQQAKLKRSKRFDAFPHEQQHPVLIGNLPDDFVLLR